MDFRVSNHCFPDPFSLSHATLHFLICVFLHLNKLNTLAEFSLRWFPGWNRIAAFLSSSPPPSAPSRPRPPLPHGLCHRAPVCVGACLCVIIGGVKTGRSVPSGSTRWSHENISTFPLPLLLGIAGISGKAFNVPGGIAAGVLNQLSRDLEN